MNPARTEILRRIREALHDRPDAERPEDVVVARAYRQRTDESHHALIEQFAERVAEYRARVQQVRAADLPATIAAACAARGARALVVPADLPDTWVPPGIELLPDHHLPYAALNAAEGVLTGCAIGIAQTGTIVLDGGVAQGRRAISLLPDYHLCIIRTDQIVGMLPEAMASLDEAVRNGRPLTFISGPSATSDIELNRVEGVHGPRTLEVLIVLDEE